MTRHAGVHALLYGAETELRSAVGMYDYLRPLSRLSLGIAKIRGGYIAARLIAAMECLELLARAS